MTRALKAFSQIEPKNAQTSSPASNQFTLDLAGLDLTPENLAQVRQEAVKAAMSAASHLIGLAGRGTLDDFGTFSTFSTFGTFGSGSARPELQAMDVGVLAPQAQAVIGRVLQAGG